MSTQPFTPPPTWLSGRLVLGGVVAGALLLPDWEMLTGARIMELGLRTARSLAVLMMALLLAATLGISIAMLARRIGRPAEKMVRWLGCALACVPVVVVAWGFVSLWVGVYGWPVETLLPAQLPELRSAWETRLGRVVWEYLAPALVLALPCVGEIMQVMTEDAAQTVEIDLSLHARGIPDGRRIWHHHLSQMLPLLGVRMESLCLLAPVYLIVVEDVLHFMGWGGWMAQGIRAADASLLALGFAVGGLLMALLGSLFGRLRHNSQRWCGSWQSLSWQPWLMWALGWMALSRPQSMVWLFLGLAVCACGGAAWSHAWTEAKAKLPLAEAQALGATERDLWRAHLWPVLWRMLAAWFASACAYLLLWATVVLALRPELLPTLGAPLAAWLSPLAITTPQDAARTLADPSALLRVGGGVALVALCLFEAGRIIRPRTH